MVPAQLAGDGGVVGAAAGALPGGVRGGVRRAGRGSARGRRRHRRGVLPRVAHARAAGRVGRAERRVRVVLPGAVGVQVAAHLPRDDGRARSRPAQVAIGHIAWVAIKLAFTGAVFVAVAALLGGAIGPGILGALAAAVLTGAAVTALVTAYAATVELAQGFTVLFRLIVIPITLFSGTFFPVEQLPAVVRPLAWISPLWHGTELARAAALDRWALLPALGHLAYLGGAAGARRGAVGPAASPGGSRSEGLRRASPACCCCARPRRPGAPGWRSSPASSSPSSTCSRSGRASGRWSGRSRAPAAPRSATPRSSRRACWRRRP